MKHRFSPREQKTLLLVGLFTLFFLWVYIAYLVGPLVGKMHDLSRQVEGAKRQLEIVERTTASLTPLEGEHRRIRETVESVRKTLPSLEELPAVIEFLSNLANQSKLKIQTIFPQRPAIGYSAEILNKEATAEQSSHGSNPTTSDVYTEIPIQIDALAGYHELGKFLSLAELGKYPLQVSSLQIAESPKDRYTHFIKIIVQSYFAPQEGAGGQSAQAVQGLQTR